MTSPLIDENPLLRRIENIERVLRELAPSIAQSFGTTVAELQEQQTELQEQQTELQEQQTQILDLLDTVVVPRSARSTASGSTVGGWSGGMASRLTATLSRPSGYTRAVVIATATYANVATVPSAGFMRVSIDSSNGSTLITTGLESSGGTHVYLSCINTHVASLTGLSTDVDVTLDFDASSVSTDGAFSEPFEGAQINAVAIFTK